jgi:hypothetical protein
MRARRQLLLHLVLCLALVASGQGLAQPSAERTHHTPPAAEPAPPSLLALANPSPPEPPAPEGELIPRELDAKDSSAGKAALRLLITPMSAAVGGVVGGLLTYGYGLFLTEPFCGNAELIDGSGCSVAFLSIITVGMTMGAAFGAWSMGEFLGGRGTLPSTLIGAAAGAVLGAAGGLGSRNEATLLLSLFTGPIIGAFLSYHISHLWVTNAEERARQATSGSRVTPVLGATPGGGLLAGLAGRF